MINPVTLANMMHKQSTRERIDTLWQLRCNLMDLLPDETMGTETTLAIFHAVNWIESERRRMTIELYSHNRECSRCENASSMFDDSNGAPVTCPDCNVTGRL